MLNPPELRCFMFLWALVWILWSCMNWSTLVVHGNIKTKACGFCSVTESHKRTFSVSKDIQLDADVKEKKVHCMWSSGHLQNYTKPKKSSIVTIWRRNVTLVKNITGNVEGKALKHRWSHWKELGNIFYGITFIFSNFSCKFSCKSQSSSFYIMFLDIAFSCMCCICYQERGEAHVPSVLRPQ